MRRKKIESSKDLDRFAQSVGRPFMYKDGINYYYLSVKRNNSEAIIGGGHFAFTIRRNILEDIPVIPSNKFLAAEEESLGVPFDKTGFWRLSAPDLHIQHMGNTPEPWMYEQLEEMTLMTNERSDEFWPEPDVTNRKLQIPFLFRNLFARLLHRCKLTRKVR